MTRFAENRRARLLAALQEYSRTHTPLPGVDTDARKNALVSQMIESLRRIEYVKRMAIRPIDPRRADPSSALFDPLRAAIIHLRSNRLDEAIWLVFLATHFGKHIRDGWRLTRDIYRSDGVPWTFDRVANNSTNFEVWLKQSYERLKGDGTSRRFGNHRKYETLRVDSDRGTSKVVKSYVEWVGANRRHEGLLMDAQQSTADDAKAVFDQLYRSMEAVISFGRTARFDYLTMLGKLGLANIEPGVPYLVGATGPLAGARLLFGNNKNAALRPDSLDKITADLGAHLGVGMQVMEDSLCNWQKSPDNFIAFRG
ncbi:hypothetical protein [Bradyrhizobium oligotrophicum]|uniref:alpha-glutamyl/putrescinyl thymine pyrophosphorylase clade 3 protein n=1 Tax=Bradyrhizobium oligotrophicum TaxID=44255 RepID=UPI003EBE4D99